jgi:DeoR family ulaG and ulaABCDEF operon transcriptional repressor
VAPLRATAGLLAACFFGVQARHAAAREEIARRTAELVAAPDTLILYDGSTLARLSEMLPASRC